MDGQWVEIEQTMGRQQVDNGQTMGRQRVENGQTTGRQQIHPDYAGIGEWARLDLQSIQHRD